MGGFELSGSQKGWVRGSLISPMSDEREFINLSLSWSRALSYQSGRVRGALISPMSDERETGICTSEELPLPRTDRDILASCKCASLRIHHPVKTEASINQLWFNTWQGIGIRPGVEYLRPKVSKRTNLKVKWLRVNFCQLYKSHVLKNRPHRKSNFLNEYLRFEHLTDPSGGATQMIKWAGIDLAREFSYGKENLTKPG